MNKLKFLVFQTSFISLGIFLGVGVYNTIAHFFGERYIGEWYFIISVICSGLLCSFPSLIFYAEKIKPFFVRIIIHFCILFAAVSLLGWLFKWYTVFSGYVLVMLIFIFVYVFVWLVTSWIYLKEDKEINNALDSIRDEE